MPNQSFKAIVFQSILRLEHHFFMDGRGGSEFHLSNYTAMLYEQNMAHAPAPKWIQLERPEALNGHRVQVFPTNYSPLVTNGMSPDDIVTTYVRPGYKHLVLNCHGTPEPLLKLGRFIRSSDLSAFAPIANMPDLKTIWISACNLAVSSEGVEFCKTLARLSEAFVVAYQLAVPDRISRQRDCIEDCEYSMPLYFDPFGALTLRQTFFDTLGPINGFRRV